MKNTIRLALTIILISLIAQSTQAQIRQWDDSEITTIKNQVNATKKKVYRSLSPEVKSVAQELDRQRLEFFDKGMLVKQVATEVLDWSLAQQDDYQLFKYGVVGDVTTNPPPCEYGSQCREIKDGLKGLVDDLDQLKTDYPRILLYGTDPDSAVADAFRKEAIEAAPPIVLYSLRHAWGNLEPELKGAVELIDDAMKIVPAPGRNIQNFRGSLGNNNNVTTRYCSYIDSQVRPDKIRVNRILALLDITTAAIDLKLIPKTYAITIVGEGTDVPTTVLLVPIESMLKVVKAVSILVKTRMANQAVCDALET